MGIGRAACKGDIHTQKEGRFLLYNILFSLLYSIGRNLLNSSYITYYLAKKGYF